MESSPLIIIIIALVILGLVWRVIKGVIRFILTLGIIAVAAYLLWTVMR